MDFVGSVIPGIWGLSTSTGPVNSLVRPFPFDNIADPKTALRHPAYKNNNKTRDGLGRVCVTVIYHSTGHVTFQTRIIAEWKVPLASFYFIPADVAMYVLYSCRKRWYTSIKNYLKALLATSFNF